MTSKTLVIIEDNPANLKLAHDILARAGYDVHTALDAATGFEVVRAACPDLILLDIQLPGIDGLTALKIFKAEPATCNIPVIAITAYAMRGDRQRFHDAGFDGYISKPLRYRQLLQYVQTLLFSPEQG